MFFRVLTMLALLLLVDPLPVRVARADDEDDTPQVESFLETRSYTRAATREVLEAFSFVVGEVDAYPAEPSPEFADKSSLRKRLLDLRLLMDFNVFAYEAGSTDRFRDLVDEAYEAVGGYKDLYEINEKYNLPMDPDERDRRFNGMINALAPLRQADVRRKLEKAYDKFEDDPVSLGFDRHPRVWQIAKLEPTDSLDSAGNAARLGQAVLVNLRAEGLLVADIFDPAQEERFHDVRKALRSVLVLSDMFPSLSAGLANAREPLFDLVKSYGKANEQIVAYHLARQFGQPMDERIAGVSKAFDKAQSQAREFAERGPLDAAVSALATVEASHRR